jgi:hypothetical protein
MAQLNSGINAVYQPLVSLKNGSFRIGGNTAPIPESFTSASI